MNKIKLQNSILDALDMDSLMSVIGTYHNYFPLRSGQEHYRLLRYLGGQVQGDIVEIGTHAGTSAIALAADSNYRVLTYDIVDRKLKDHSDRKNIVFRLADYSMDTEYENRILNSKMIFIDAPHSGAFERECYDWLKQKGYKGFTVWDDIHLNAEMSSFWADVDLPKQDITKYGHVTGTGVIYFSKDIELVF